MAWIERGRVQGGAIDFPQPLALPEGTEVEVRIEPMISAAAPATTSAADEDFEKLDAFGVWADRSETADGAEWVRNERAKWQQRVTRRA
jgi:hypothetical protein